MAAPFDVLLSRAYVPYSRTPNAAIAVLADGRWVPGVRVECASFPLTIPAVTAALVGAQATVGLDAVVAVMAHQPITVSEQSLISEAIGRPIRTEASAHIAVGDGFVVPSLGTAVDIKEAAPPPVVHSAGPSMTALVKLANRVAWLRARVPLSDFPVGCYVSTEGGAAVAGVNVEFDDWTRGLCAERTALALTLAYGLTPTGLFVSCVKVPGGTPCGACRQVIAELLPDGPIWIDQHDAPPRRTSAFELLPDAFIGASLRSAAPDTATS